MYASADPVNLTDPDGLFSILGAAKGCVEGISSKIGPRGPVLVKVGKKLIKVLPGPSKFVDCAAGAIFGGL